MVVRKSAGVMCRGGCRVRGSEEMERAHKRELAALEEEKKVEHEMTRLKVAAASPPARDATLALTLRPLCFPSVRSS